MNEIYRHELSDTLIEHMILVLPLCLFYIKKFLFPWFLLAIRNISNWVFPRYRLPCLSERALSDNQASSFPQWLRNVSLGFSYFDQREMLGGTFHSLSKKNQMERLNEFLCCKVQFIVMKYSCWPDFMCHLALQPVTHLAGSSHDLNSLFTSRVVQNSSNVILYKMQIIK